MHLLSLETIDKAYPERLVLRGASLGISSGQRTGVIGRNGSGKSTLLRIVAGSEEIDSGKVVRKPGLAISVLDQDPRFPPAARLQDILGEDRPTIAMADRLGLIDPQVRAGELSGGQRKRLALAVAMATDCDILILDEPTNHLDVDAIEWLEAHLVRRSSALLLVTHDRYLLDRVADRVVEVHDSRLYPHRGTYAEYLEARAAREEHQATVEHRTRQRLRTELAWLRRRPRARTSKSKYRVEQVRRLSAVERKETATDVTLDLPARRIGAKVVHLVNAGKRFADRWVLRGVDLRLQPDARIGVVGPNGSGKTTLLRLIAGRIAPDEGKVTSGTTITAGWYGQETRPLDAGTRLLAVVRERAEMTRVESGVAVSASQLLERFLFDGETQRSTVGDLSGGERRRLELLLVLMEAPNLLLLDEPTNDLDLDTLDALEDYLDAWPGAMVTASHDRYFLDRVCRDIYSIEPDGSVRHHPGGWSGYRADVEERRRASPHSDRRTPREPRPVRRTRLSFDENRELARLDEQIPALENLRTELSDRLRAAGADHEEASRASQRLDEAVTQLEAAETRWLDLSDEAERLAQTPRRDRERELPA